MNQKNFTVKNFFRRAKNRYSNVLKTMADKEKSLKLRAKELASDNPVTSGCIIAPGGGYILPMAPVIDEGIHTAKAVTRLKRIKTYKQPKLIMASDVNIKFRQKEYTIQGGRYLGPKDVEKVPGALELIGKGTLIGGVTGGLIGYGLEKYGEHKLEQDRFAQVPNTNFADGRLKGSLIGAGAGLAMKILLNTMHNPMSSIKYQEVDQAIRQRFGIYRVSGITVGDSLDKRNKLDLKFVFNDRNIEKYRINIAIQDGSFTMYVFNLSNKELDDLDKILDYYCKKYSGMDYRSSPIGNNNDNSYSINIVFTNYQVIADFLEEVSDKLMCIINILDNKALIETRSNIQLDRKNFSVPDLEKLDIFNAIINQASGFTKYSMYPAQTISRAIIKAIIECTNRIEKNKILMNTPVAIKDLNNKFLELTLNKCGFVEGLHYTVDAKDKPINIHLMTGIFIITTSTISPEGKKIEKLYDLNRKFFKKQTVSNGRVNVYTHSVTNRSQFEVLLKKIMGQGVKPNIYVS